jgi:hypothetical protein
MSVSPSSTRSVNRSLLRLRGRGRGRGRVQPIHPPLDKSPPPCETRPSPPFLSYSPS